MARFDPFRPAIGHGHAYLPGWTEVEHGFAQATVYAGFLMSTGALIPILFMGERISLSNDDMASMRLLLVPFMLAVPLLVLAIPVPVADAMARNPLVLTLLLLAMLSTFWSINPDVTFRRLLSLLVFTVFAFWAHARFGFERLLRMLAHFVMACMIGSLLLALLAPKLAFMPNGLQLRGIFGHKNGLGQILIVTVLIHLVALEHRLLSHLQATVGLMMALAMGAMTGSASALGIILCLGLVALVIHGASLPRGLVAICLAFAVAACSLLAVLVLHDPDLPFRLMGRDPSFTGRTRIWDYAWLMASQRFWFGYGYQAFWSVPDHSLYAFQSFGWRVPNAHSGYLDHWLSLGIVGLGLTILLLADAVLRGICAIMRGSSAAGEFMLLLILAYIVANLFESDLVGHTSIYWILLIIGLAACPWSRPPAQSVKRSWWPTGHAGTR